MEKSCIKSNSSYNLKLVEFACIGNKGDRGKAGVCGGGGKRHVYCSFLMVPKKTNIKTLPTVSCKTR